MEFEFEGTVIEWRGPAPFYFVPVPQDLSDQIRALAKTLSYGWGVIPVSGTIGHTSFTTSLFPKDGLYLVPIKVVVQRAEGIELGHSVSVTMTLGPSP